MGTATGTPMGGPKIRTRGPAALKVRARQDQAARDESKRLASVPMFDFGTTDEQKRMTAVFGAKVRTLEWSEYMTAARVRPWTLDATRAHDTMTDRLIMQPKTRTIDPKTAKTIDRLARLIEDGTITGSQYFALLAGLKFGMTPAEHAQQVTR